MKLSLRSEYALLTLIHLSRHIAGGSSLDEIAISQQIPAEPLAEILFVLAQAKYLRGSGSSYQLVAPSDKIAVIDIIRLFDGALAPLEPVSEKGYQPAPMEKEEKLAGLFTELQEQIIEKLERTTLADLI